MFKSALYLLATATIASAQCPMGHGAGASSPASISLPAGFMMSEVDPKFANPSMDVAAMTTGPPLGVLVNFTGSYVGTGISTIFRPNGPGGTTFNNTVTSEPAISNVLLINLMSETMTFAAPIGNTPNRGLGSQSDTFLNGVPYIQAINDVTNTGTGKGDGIPNAIHFETGLWMHVPATNNNPVNQESYVRMASIPHGSTVNAQNLSALTTIPGPPIVIPAVDISPFVGQRQNATNKIRQASQNVNNTNTARLPQDLTKFSKAGTITQTILDDPNVILRNAIINQTIVQTAVFIVGTQPNPPETGGGVANIAFLEGGSTAAGGPNGRTVSMQEIFWVETVECILTVPKWAPGQPPLLLKPTPPNQWAEVPTFSVVPPRPINAPIKIKVQYNQMQYSQEALLSFGGVTWPHVNAATLQPADPVPVPPSAFN